MADQPDNLTIQILREIQSDLGRVNQKLEDHDRRFDRMQAQIDNRIDGAERKIGELIEISTRALGKADVSIVRHDSAQYRFAEVEMELRELRGRIRELEDKV